MTTIRLAIVEDSRVLREGLAAGIERERDIEIVTSVAEHDRVIDEIGATRPDALLVNGQSHNPARLVHLARQRVPSLSAVAMNVMADHEDVLQLVRAGVVAFVLEDATIGELAETIRRASGGGHVLPAALVGALFSQITLGMRHAPFTLAPAARMTRREQEIVQLISTGLSNKEIARHLNIATHTVKSHVHNLLEKLGAQTRVQLATLCVPEKTDGARIVRH